MEGKNVFAGHSHDLRGVFGWSAVVVGWSVGWWSTAAVTETNSTVVAIRPVCWKVVHSLLWSFYSPSHGFA